MPKPTIVIPPNLGLYLGQPSITIPARALEDGLNFRIKREKLTSFGMGWEPFTRQTLGSPVVLMDEFFHADGTLQLIAGTLVDLFEWDEANDKWLFITQRYETGTASAAGTAVTGVGTAWSTNSPPVRVGDEISFGATGRRDPNDLWYPITAVPSDTSITLGVTAGTIGAGAYTIRQKFQGTTLNHYWRTATFPRSDVSAVIKDRWYATNDKIDNIVRLAQGDTQVTRIHLGAGGFKCRHLQRYKNMLLYMNVVENSGTTPDKPQSMKNSDVGKPETMTGGLAGEFVVGPQTAEIVSSSQIADDVAVYTANEVVTATFVGTPDKFAFRTAVNGTGLIAGRLLSQFTETHQFMGRDALYDFNGIQANAVDNHIWVHVLRQQDQNRIEASYTIFDEESGQLIWATTLTGDTGPSALTNLLLYSEQLNSAVYTLTNATVTANSANDPLTNLATADKLLEDATAAAQHGIRQDVTKAASSITYTYSAYCDPDTRTKVRLRLGDSTDTDTAFADFDLGAGTLIGTGTSGAGFSAIATSITAVGSFFRISLTASTDSDTTLRCAVRLLDGSGSVTYNGDGASGMWVWGLQLEQSSTLGTYIRTSTAAAAASTLQAPEIAWEASYLEDLKPGTPTPYGRRQFPFTVVGFYERAAELTWNDLPLAWTAYTFGWTDRVLSGAFPLMLAGDVYGRIYKLGVVDTQDGAGYASYVTFPRRAISDLRTRNMLKRVYTLTKRLPSATYDLTVTTSLYDHADSIATVNVVSSFDLALAGQPWVPVYRVGRFGQVQFGTAGSTTGEPWELNAYDWDVTPGGGA